jgi:hypothetical protein
MNVETQNTLNELKQAWSSEKQPSAIQITFVEKQLSLFFPSMYHDKEYVISYSKI